MSAALDAGLDVTALHDHFLWDTPRVMFMHVGGMGDEAALATAVGKVFAKLHDTAGGKGETPPKLAIDPATSKLDAAALDAARAAAHHELMTGASGRAAELAKTIKTALDTQAK
jgi:hypothetical protein